MSKLISLYTAPHHPRACCLILALLTFMIAGCSTGNYRKSDAVASSMKNAAGDVQFEAQLLDHSMNCLKALTGTPQGDLRPLFKQYSASVDQLRKASLRNEATGKRMAQKGLDYFVSWDRRLQEIDYQHIRDLSAARRTEATNRFTAIEQRYGESQAAVAPLIAYLQDIRTALDADLTMEGIASLKDIVQNAEANSQKLKTALEALTSELVNTSTRFASLAPVVQGRDDSQ